MSPVTETRVGGIVLSVLVGLVVPAFLVGPVLFGSTLVAALPGWALPLSIGLSAYGVWMALVSLLASRDDVEFVTGIFQANELVVLLLPVALFVGTRAIYQRITGAKSY
jgi:hypothetical protein